MYSWLQSTWVGTDAPEAFTSESPDEAVLLPDWLRLSLVRSARPALLEAGLRGLPAHKLALFIQTFGMPVSSMRCGIVHIFVITVTDQPTIQILSIITVYLVVVGAGELNFL